MSKTIDAPVKKEQNTAPIYHQTIDFKSLMHEARKHITALAGQVWSNHNSADAGITQMEVLAFCIADLSYRTSFDVKDIVTGYKGNLTEIHDLPLADIALPNSPVTIKDLRKVLIDMPHPNSIGQKSDQKLLVRNAFPVIAEGTEVDFYAASKFGRDSFLTFDTTFVYDVSSTETTPDNGSDLERGIASLPAPASIDDPIKTKTKSGSDKLGNKQKVNLSSAQFYAEHRPLGTTSHNSSNKEFKDLDQIILNGLYGLQIEFEEDASKTDNFLKDLNQNYFEEELTTASGDKFTISVLMPYWDDIKWNLKNVDLSTTTITYHKRGPKDYFIAVDKLNYDDYFYDYFAEILIGDHKMPLFIKIKTKITDTITIDGKNYTFTVDFLDWNEISNGVSRDYDGNNAPGLTLNSHKVNNVTIKGENYLFDIQTSYEYYKETIKTNSNGTFTSTFQTTKRTKSLLTRVEFEDNTVFSHSQLNIVPFELSARFNSYYNQKKEREVTLFTHLTKKNAAIYTDYKTKINQVFDYLYDTNGIWSHLGQFRNLCEDFSKFSASRVQEIALFGKIIAEPNYNINELLSEVYFRVDEFLNPLVKFNSLSQMTAKGYAFDDLFNGPLLQHGFVEDADLDNLKRRSVVYTSDLVRIIMDVPGVSAVENFSISSYIDNRLMGRNVINCLSLTNSDIYKPRFSAEKTKMQICVDSTIKSTNSTEVGKWHTEKLEWIQEQVNIDNRNNGLVDTSENLNLSFVKKWYLQKIKAAKSQQISQADNIELKIPTGEDMEIEKYHSIQHDFPEIYGIGKFGLPIDATNERKASAKQLKAFLLPFEQLMANYLKQIAHLPELFSYHRNIESTYATQPLYNVPDVQPIFADFDKQTDTWDNFTQNINNAYETTIKKGESNEEFLSRRSRFLSHLLARFGESFEAYATQMFDQHKNILNDLSNVNAISDFRIARAETLETLIEDKIAFAEDYQKVSSERYKSFNMTVKGVDRANGQWDNDNIASYKRRLCRLLGIKKVDNGSIFKVSKDNTGEWIDIEGMHIVEHILLRPRTKNAKLMDLNMYQLPNGGTSIYDSEKDPYSFTITVVLPRYAGRFTQLAFREFTERLIRMETPAHIRVNFNWTGGACGENFEKHYSAWKQNVYKIKPFAFQNIDNYADLNQKLFKQDPLRKDDQLLKRSNKRTKSKKDLLKEISQTIEIVDSGIYTYAESLTDGVRPDVLQLQDNLLLALGTPCLLKLSVYDNHNKQFPVVNDKVTFEDFKTDIYHLRVSEIGGKISVYSFDRNQNKYHFETEFGPITKPYFDITDFLTFTQRGLTTLYGGMGKYKITYQLDGRDPVEQIIDVTKAIIPVQINVGKFIPQDPTSGVMYTYDTETMGVFRVSNKTWKGLFYEFSPLSRSIYDQTLLGEGFISSLGNNLAATPINGGAENKIYFTAIYSQYGLGLFHIEYKLDGQTTFADLELFLELEINVFNQGIKLVPDNTNLITIPHTMRVVDLLFEIPGGSLKIFDLDGISEAPIITDKFDGNLYGTMEYYKSLDNLTIDRDTNTKYIDGHRYEFVYNHSGFDTRVIILFEVQTPTVEILENGRALMEEPFILDLDNKKVEYQLRFNPKNSNGVISVEQAGLSTEIQSLIVPTDNFTKDLDISTLKTAYGFGPYHVTNSNNKGLSHLQFLLKIKPQISLFQDKKLLKKKPFVLDMDLGNYSIHLNEPTGNFRLFTKKDEEILIVENLKSTDLIIPLDLELLNDKYKGQTFFATYKMGKDAVKLEFTIKETIVKPTITLFNEENPIKEQPFILDPKKGKHTIHLNEPNGFFRLYTQDGDEILDIEKVIPSGLIIPLNLEELNDRYKGQTFLAVYKIGDNEVEVKFTIKEEKEEPIIPIITLFNGEFPLKEQPFILDPKKGKYAIHLTEPNGFFRLYSQDGNKILGIGKVDLSGLIIPLDLEELNDRYKGQTFLAVYKIGDTEVEVSFTINGEKEEPIIPTIILFNGEFPLKEEPFILDPKKGKYAIYLNEPNGFFRLYTQDGDEIFEIEKVDPSSLIIPLKIEELNDRYKGQTFIAVYKIGDNEVEVTFTIIGEDEIITVEDIDVIKDDRIEDGELIIDDGIDIVGVDEYGEIEEESDADSIKTTIVTIFDTSKEGSIAAKDDVYYLEYDYKNTKQTFEFKFNTGNGTLIFIAENGQKHQVLIEGNSIQFNGKDNLPKGLENGEYTVQFIPENGNSISFLINVINLNPIFIIKNSYFDSPDYIAKAIPLHEAGNTYIWRLNGKYVSRAKEPKLKFHFTKTISKINVELTLHLHDYEAVYAIDLTSDDIKKLSND